MAGEPIRTDDWIADTADKLGVTAAWIAGFIDGFAQVQEGAADADYLQGFLAAQAFRQHCPDLVEGEKLPGPESRPESHWRLNGSQILSELGIYAKQKGW